MYAIEGGRELAKALESVSDLLPLPFLSTFVNVGIKVLEACKEATVIEENVKDLQGRVYNLMLVVVHSTINKEASLELQKRIAKLQSVLDGVLKDLAQIKEQRKWLLVFFRDLNKERVDKCVVRLNNALEKFQLESQLRVEASQLRATDLLDKIQELLAKIKAEHASLAPQLDRIEAAVNKISQPHNSPHPREDMPSPHDIFYGREAIVSEIVSLLAIETTSRVCITGAGGMGKTSVALAVVNRAMTQTIFMKQYVFWIPCVEAKTPDLLRRILYAQLRITAETYDSLDPLIAELGASKERRLLLLDNFETCWLSDENQPKVREILVRLTKLSHIALLVTMTSGFAPGHIDWQHRPLPPLDPIAARAAFTRKYRDAAGYELAGAGPELDEFLTCIGHIPLAITLTAASGGSLESSPNDLLRDWEKVGTEMVSADGLRSMEDTIRLSMERGVVKSNPEALTLLAILSMLPAGTAGGNLRWWAPTLTVPSAAVRTLRTAALIERGDGPFENSRIFVRPTIQSYMLHKDRISTDVRDQVHDACYKFVLDHKSIPDDHKFKADLEALGSEETNIQGLLMEIRVGSCRPNAVDALIVFGVYQSWTKPSLVVASHALEVARAVYNDPHVADRDAAARRVAQAHQCVGKTLLALGRYAEAWPHSEKARDLFKNVGGGPDLYSAGECSMQLLQTHWFMPYSDLMRPHDRRFLVKEAQAHLSHDETDKYHVARGHLLWGQNIWWSGTSKINPALEAISTAKAIFEELDCAASTAECLLFIARFHIRSEPRDDRTALIVAQEALAKAEQSGEPGLISQILHIMAISLVSLRMYKEAAVTISQLLPLCQALGSPLGIGDSLELLAYNCAAMMDLQGARIAFREAHVQFGKTGGILTGQLGANNCARNLEKLECLTEMEENDFSALAKPLRLHSSPN
ncbi:hypothetical protein K438DRAFT_1977547 [Mycena galopus ATCC 62051]|nr:hypothetical protein K438DRAFT_1977547 [Mycena galopus ATCC 62051]